MQLTRVAHTLGVVYFFDAEWPERRYVLDLTVHYERQLVHKLRMIGLAENVRSMELHLPNTSQLADQSCFRNLTKDDVPFTHEMLKTLPDKGVLKFDFVRRTPPKGKATLSDRAFMKFKEDFSQNGTLPAWSGFPPGTANSLFFLSQHGKDFAITTAQLIALTRLFKTEEERVNLVLSFFGRIVDPHRLGLLCEEWTVVEAGSDAQSLGTAVSTVRMAAMLDPLRLEANNSFRLKLGRTLGWLNFWSPLFAEGFYVLDLSLPDERAVCGILVYLAVVENGENWIAETFNGQPFDLPASWEHDVPTKGIVTLTYYVVPAEVKKSCRWKSIPLCLTAMYWDESEYLESVVSGTKASKSKGHVYLYNLKGRNIDGTKLSEVKDRLRKSFRMDRRVTLNAAGIPLATADDVAEDSELVQASPPAADESSTHETASGEAAAPAVLDERRKSAVTAVLTASAAIARSRGSTMSSNLVPISETPHDVAAGTPLESAASDAEGTRASVQVVNFGLASDDEALSIASSDTDAESDRDM